MLTFLSSLLSFTVFARTSFAFSTIALLSNLFLLIYSAMSKRLKWSIRPTIKKFLPRRNLQTLRNVRVMAPFAPAPRLKTPSQQNKQRNYSNLDIKIILVNPSFNPIMFGITSKQPQLSHKRVPYSILIGRLAASELYDSVSGTIALSHLAAKK